MEIHWSHPDAEARPFPHCICRQPSAPQTSEACRRQSAPYRAENSQPVFFQFTVLSFLFDTSWGLLACFRFWHWVSSFSPPASLSKTIAASFRRRCSRFSFRSSISTMSSANKAFRGGISFGIVGKSPKRTWNKLGTGATVWELLFCFPSRPFCLFSWQDVAPSSVQHPTLEGLQLHVH